MPHKPDCDFDKRMYIINYGMCIRGHITYEYTVCTNCGEEITEINKDTGERKAI